MKTAFEKIYVISLITNKKRQNFIRYQFNELGIKFEFIYGIDFYKIRKDYKKDKIIWPETFLNNPNSSKTFGCSISHYNAVLQAYYAGYNNVLIIEDDICFIKNKSLINDYLINIPKNADFITYDPRFLVKEEQTLVINDFIKNNNKKWLTIDNEIDSLSCALIYGIMNRKTMKLYLDMQRNSLNPADSVNKIFRKPIVKRYYPNKCIGTDQFNIYYDINKKSTYCFLENMYKKIYKDINNDLFFVPKKYLLFTRK